MSGGSWDYVYARVDEIVSRLLMDPDPVRRTLGKRLADLPAALKAIEWVDSSDSGPGSEHDPIRKCLETMGVDATRAVLIERLDTAEEQLRRAREELGDEQA